MNSQKGNILAILMILILLAGLGAGVFLTTKGSPLKLFSKASSESVTIVFDTDKAEKKVNDLFTVGVLIKPGSAEVIGVDITLEDTGQAIIKGTILPESDILDYNILADDTNLHYVAVNTDKSKIREGMLKPYGLQFTALKSGSGAIKITKAAIVTTKGVVDQANIKKEAVLSYTILSASTPAPTPIATAVPTPTPPARSIPSPVPSSTSVTTTISVHSSPTLGNPVTFKAAVSTGGTLSQATIWLAKGDRSSGARIDAGDIKDFDASNFNCSDKTQNCIWYRIGKTTTAGEFSGTVTFLKSGSYVAIASAENTEKGSDGNIVACSANPYVARPFIAWGKTYSLCLDPKASIPDVTYVQISP